MKDNETKAVELSGEELAQVTGGNADMPFLMPAEDVFTITGRGTVATGRIERGIIGADDQQ